MFTVFTIEFVIIMIPVRCLFMETCGDSIAVIDDLRYNYRILACKYVALFNGITEYQYNSH